VVVDRSGEDVGEPFTLSRAMAKPRQPDSNNDPKYPAWGGMESEEEEEEEEEEVLLGCRRSR
jgi:hypothetical protein